MSEPRTRAVASPARIAGALAAASTLLLGGAVAVWRSVDDDTTAASLPAASSLATQPPPGHPCPAHSFELHLVDEDGRAVAGAELRPRRGAHETLGGGPIVARSNEAGRLCVPPPAGNMRWRVGGDGLAPRRIEGLPYTPRTMTLYPSASLAGRVEASSWGAGSTPPRDCEVRINEMDHVRFIPLRVAALEADGSFRVGGLPSGHPLFAEATCAEHRGVGRARVVLAPHEAREGLVVPLVDAVSLRVRLLDADQGPCVEGYVNTWSKENGWRSARVHEGSARILGLSPTTLRVSTACASESEAIHEVTLDARGETRVELRPEAPRHPIELDVRTQTKQALEDLPVLFVRVENADSTDAVDPVDGPNRLEGWTDAEGHLSVRLPEGRWKVLPRSYGSSDHASVSYFDVPSSNPVSLELPLEATLAERERWRDAQMTEDRVLRNFASGAIEFHDLAPSAGLAPRLHMLSAEGHGSFAFAAPGRGPFRVEGLDAGIYWFSVPGAPFRRRWVPITVEAGQTARIDETAGQPFMPSPPPVDGADVLGLPSPPKQYGIDDAKGRSPRNEERWRLHFPGGKVDEIDAFAFLVNGRFYDAERPAGAQRLYWVEREYTRDGPRRAAEAEAELDVEEVRLCESVARIDLHCVARLRGEGHSHMIMYGPPERDDALTAQASRAFAAPPTRVGSVADAGWHIFERELLPPAELPRIDP